MSRNRTAAVLVTGSMLVGAVPVAASAEPASPLYLLVDTAAQRLATADPVAATKWLNGARYVRAVFTDQIGATEGIQYTRFAQWKFDPPTAPTTAPDLSASRTAIDGFNEVMVDEIALQWNSLRGPSCQAEIREATDAVAAARALEPLYRQALSSATRSYCLT
jgi:chorismate mutase